MTSLTALQYFFFSFLLFPKEQINSFQEKPIFFFFFYVLYLMHQVDRITFCAAGPFSSLFSCNCPEKVDPFSDPL